MPAAVKARKRTPFDWVKANPIAVPRNGAVQGVARAVASTPWTNAPPAPCPPATALPNENPRISKTPNRFIAKTTT
ncbi:MAG: hypothetical protein ACRD2J_05335, partial [Thermoanaerobaculia bacterium]